MTQAIQISSKLPDGRIFVVGGDNIDAFEQNLMAIVGADNTANLMDEMSRSLTGVADTRAAVANVVAAFPGATVDHTAHPVGNANTSPASRSCVHGVMTKREGSGAKGPWKGFMCPTPKGTADQCEPIFIRRGTPEWSSF